MRDLNYQLKGLCARNRDGSYASQAARERNLSLIADQLHELGFRNLKVTGLKPKHVTSLLDHWNKQKLSISTVKNRLSNIRWWAEKIGKFDMLPASNDAYNIPKRTYVTNQDKAIQLTPAALEKIKDSHLRMSLELQAAFGLRREEALKFQPYFADEGNRVVLKASWCKGGQQREIPITNEYQRDVLDRAHKLAGRGSMIPNGLSYRQQLKKYERSCTEAGLNRAHGLRHNYAQRRYEELTGWKAPVVGGPKSGELTPEQKQLDRAARLQISEELGHHREEITAVYLGR